MKGQTCTWETGDERPEPAPGHRAAGPSALPWVGTVNRRASLLPQSQESHAHGLGPVRLRNQVPLLSFGDESCCVAQASPVYLAPSSFPAQPISSQNYKYVPLCLAHFPLWRMRLIQMWWCMPVTPAFGGLRQNNWEFKASLLPGEKR